MIRGLVIDTHADGYGFDQCGRTMTVSELVSYLSGFSPDIPVYLGNNREGYWRGEPSWYSYGAICTDHIIERNEEDEQEEEDEE